MCLMKTIGYICSRNSIQTEVNKNLTDKIPVENGIRQGDSLNPLFFSIKMDEIVKQLGMSKGYWMGNE